MRIALVALGSFTLTAAIIANAFIQKQQFYPAAVFITKSNPSMAVLYVQAFVLVLLVGKMMRKVFFGQLRAAETEHLIERFWYAVTETCLAFTVFRDDFSPKFVALFTMLLFLKGFHWLAEDRIDYMERSPIISFKFHIRALGLLMFLGLMDSVLIHHAFRRTMQSGASVQLVFGFEYAILLTMVVTTFMKYVLHTIDLQRENPWENKTVFLLYTDLITGFIKVLLYIIFLAIMIKIHTFPLFAIRPMYLTLRAFKKSVSDVVLSRRAIAFMNSVYPDATEEELAQMDNVCIICREEMTSGKKLPCNHIFHAHCLRSWFQRQQSCPTCRMDVLRPVAPQQQQPQQRTPPDPGQPPPQAQQPHNVPGFGVPGMPPVPPFAMWNHLMAPPPGAPQQPEQLNTNIGTAPPATGPGAATGPPPVGPLPFPPGSGTQIPPTAGSPPSFFMPPFMFPPMFGMMPPPAMPPFMPNLSGLTDEQLRSMEGQERENVEARIRILRNIHSLLDSAILQLNQYSQVIVAINSMSQNTGSENDPTPSTSEMAPDLIGPDIIESEDEDIENISEEEYKDSIDFGSELRKRRLEKFSASNDTTQSKTEDADSKDS